MDWMKIAELAAPVAGKMLSGGAKGMEQSRASANTLATDDNFTVEGSGMFPYDMLRYDQCWPSSEQDSPRLIDPYGFGGEGLVRVSTRAMYAQITAREEIRSEEG